MKNSSKNPAPLAPSSDAPYSGDMVENASAEPSVHTTLVPKKHSKSVDPAAQPTANRVKVMAHSGAKYGIRAKVQGGIDPAAGATLGNGRLFTSAVNRTSPNFTDGYAHLD
jgi:hypothetical protein